MEIMIRYSQMITEVSIDLAELAVYIEDHDDEEEEVQDFTIIKLLVLYQFRTSVRKFNELTRHLSSNTSYLLFTVCKHRGEA